MTRLWLHSILFTSLCSCGGNVYIESTSTSRYSFEILKPAESGLDSDIRTLMVMPGEPTLQSGIFTDKETEVTEKTEYYIHSLFGETTNILVDILTESPRYIIKIPKNEGVEFPTSLFNWEELDSAGKNEGIDAFLVLDAVQSSTRFTLQSNLLRIDSEDDPPEIAGQSLDYFYLLDTKAEFTWKIYRPLVHEITTKKIRLTDVETGLHFPTKKEALAADEEISNSLLLLAGQAATKFSLTVAPVWETTSREFFNKGNRDMREAAKRIVENRVEDAGEIWEKLASNINPGISKEARFNLILFYELRGEFEEGLKIANDLIKEYKMPEARVYAEILKVRMDDKSKLDEQFR